jgi:hypothetical protein
LLFAEAMNGISKKKVKIKVFFFMTFYFGHKSPVDFCN